MSKSKNNRTTKRGTHSQRVKSHDVYLVSKFPGFSNMTNPFSAPVAEMLDEELATYSDFIPNQETVEAMKECDEMFVSKATPRFNTVEDLMKDLNSENRDFVGTCSEDCGNCIECEENGDCCLPGTDDSLKENPEK